MLLLNRRTRRLTCECTAVSGTLYILYIDLLLIKKYINYINVDNKTFKANVCKVLLEPVNNI